MTSLSIATRLSLVGALVSCMASPTAAQASRDSAVMRALSAFSEGQPIRVALLRSRWAGSYLGVSGDTLFFGRQNPPPMALRFNAIDTVWRATRATGRGLRIGAVAGGILGAAFMGALSANLGEGENFLAAVAVGAGGGALGGAAAGALVGSRFRRWRQVYP